MEKSMRIKFMTTTDQTSKLGWSLQSLIAWCSDHYDHYDHPFLKLYILKKRGTYTHALIKKYVKISAKKVVMVAGNPQTFYLNGSQPSTPSGQKWS